MISGCLDWLRITVVSCHDDIDEGCKRRVKLEIVCSAWQKLVHVHSFETQLCSALSFLYFLIRDFLLNNSHQSDLLISRFYNL